MDDRQRNAISRRSLLLQALMVVPLWQLTGLPGPAGLTPPSAASAKDEFVEVNGWILRRSDVA
jgi:hypothetical protein